MIRKRPKYATAEEMAAAQRDISVAEFFAKNRHLLGFDNASKALLTTVREAVDNALDACEEAGILPEITVEVAPVRTKAQGKQLLLEGGNGDRQKGFGGADRLLVTVQDNGPGIVKEQAEAEGLDKIFIAAGFEWREPGCSMCLAMNPDKLKPEERCASTSNRNFEGRQGFKGRTHLVSPAMAAAAAIAGHFVDVREWR